MIRDEHGLPHYSFRAYFSVDAVKTKNSRGHAVSGDLHIHVLMEKGKQKTRTHFFLDSLDYFESSARAVGMFSVFQ